MPSSVSKEDIEAELYRAGIRSRFIISRLMNMITLYALAEARKAVPLEDVFRDSYAYLMPGEWDRDVRITRCVKCTVPKAWSHYGIDKTHPTGHKVLCKSCTRVRPPEPRVFKCISCEKKKSPEEYSKRKQANPRIREKCLQCQETTSG